MVEYYENEACTASGGTRIIAMVDVFGFKIIAEGTQEEPQANACLCRGRSL